jgi:uncharacterized membrane protein
VSAVTAPATGTAPVAVVTPTTAAHPGRALGIAVAAWFLLASFTPSLVPRSWYVQGVTSGLAARVRLRRGSRLGVGRAPRWCGRSTCA